MQVYRILPCFLVVFATAECLDYFSGFEKSWKPRISNILRKKSGKSRCANELKAFIDDLLERKMWALEMFDAWAKPQTGILNGNLAQMGNFDQCLAVRGEHKNRTIRGKYCTAVLQLTEKDTEEVFKISMLKQNRDKINDRNLKAFLINVEMTWDFCIPVSCSGKELQEFWNLTNITENYGLKLIFDESRCLHAKKKLEEKSLDFFATAFFTTTGLLLLFSTLYDVFTSSDKENGFKRQLLTSFSVYTNSVMLFTSKFDPNALHCINGIRVLSVIFVILNHQLLFNTISPMTNRVDLVDFKNESSEYIIYIGMTFIVDTYFAVSGLLVVYVYLSKSETSKFSYFTYCLHRIIRLTPSLLAVILVLSNLAKFLGVGPLWTVVSREQFQSDCENYKWLHSLLYVQNWYGKQCSGHAWYVSVDTQMYFLAPLFLPHFHRNPKKTISAILGTTMAICLAFFWITWRFEFPATAAHLYDSYLYYYYMSTYARCKPWLVGCVFGYLIYKTKKEGIVISRHLVAFFWLLTFVIMLSLTYVAFLLQVRSYNILYSSLFNGFTRPIWGVCVCWVIFACTNGYGGPLNTFLSSSIFNQLAKLNYSMYMVHTPVLLYFVLKRRHPQYFGFANLIYESAGDLLLSSLAAVAWTLAFESPFRRIENLLFRRGIKRIEDGKESVGKQE